MPLNKQNMEPRQTDRHTSKVAERAQVDSHNVFINEICQWFDHESPFEIENVDYILSNIFLDAVENNFKSLTINVYIFTFTTPCTLLFL